MSTPLRLSPIHATLQSLKGSWCEINHMPVLMTSSDDSHGITLGLADVSFLTRFGVKGASAADWLAEQGLPLPDRPNTWHPLPQGGIIARLGLTEFLVEDGGIQAGEHGAIAPHLAAACQVPPPRVYPVLRQDLALVLLGDRTQELLRQTCSFNFQAVSLGDRPVILTSMIGVAVTVIPGVHNEQLFYRIWCDGTFGTYVWQTLVAIAAELGGGAIGVEMALLDPG